MGSTLFFQNQAGNDLATLGMTFAVNGTPTDPVAVSCVITDPTGSATTHTFGGASPADITRTSTGIYALNIPCTITGLWGYVWVGTGSASDVQPGTWTVHPASTISQFYTSVEEVKDRLSITDTQSDFQLELAVQGAAKWVERYCARHFYQITETRTFVPYDIYEMPIDDLVSVTSFATDNDGDGIYEQAWVQNTDYELAYSMWEYAQLSGGEQRPFTQVRAVNAVGGGKFFPFTWSFSRLDRIQVTGTWGWPQVPFAVKQATIQAATELYKLKDTPFGLAGTSELGIMRLPRTGNPYVSNLLAPYRHPRRKVGV